MESNPTGVLFVPAAVTEAQWEKENLGIDYEVDLKYRIPTHTTLNGS